MVFDGFPEFDNDEMTYGGIGRYKPRLEPISNKDFVCLMGEDKFATIITDLPTHLQYLSNMIPSVYGYTPEYIALKHTLLPFYRLFLLEKTLSTIFKAMLIYKGRYLGYLGVGRSSTIRPKYLRTCPKCALEDISQLGYPYWHRTHQLPGIDVCYKHKVFLEESNLSNITVKSYIQAKDVIDMSKPSRPLDLEQKEHQIMLNMAHDGSWLLNQTEVIPNYSNLHKLYYTAFQKQKWIAPHGALRLKELAAEFTKFYSESFLASQSCGVGKYPWMANIIRNTPTNIPVNKHLLMIQFLGYSVEDFFKIAPVTRTNQPPHQDAFGQGPWPCLNKVCSCYKQTVINKYIPGSSSKGGRVKAVFTCTRCGFVYARLGPDKTNEDKFRRDGIVFYGKVWERTLIKVWNDTSLSVLQKAKYLGVDPGTVLKQAVRLQLTFPPPGSTRTTRTPTSTSYTNVREEHQKSWLSILKSNPGQGIGKLRVKYKTVYSWLRENDREWFDQHKPPRIKHRGQLVDWQTIDSLLAPQVDLAGLGRSLDVERRERVTAVAIINDIGQPKKYAYSLEKLPQTAKILEKYVETHEYYAIRRIKTELDRCVRYNNPLPMYKFKGLAGVAHLKNIPEIIAALERAKSILETLPKNSAN